MELLVVLPTVQILCSRLRILVLPQLRVVVCHLAYPTYLSFPLVVTMRSNKLLTDPVVVASRINTCLGNVF